MQTPAELSSDELSAAYREHTNCFVPEAQVRAEFDTLLEVNAWSAHRIRPQDWLSNFDESELPFALQMLHGFVFFSEHLTEQMFLSAFHQISAAFSCGKEFSVSVRDWNRFYGGCILTHVLGERSNPAESGPRFSRMARQMLGINDAAICDPDAAALRLARGRGADVVFVDDFVGSGNQFVDFWTRQFRVDGRLTSFSRLMAQGKITSAHLCTAIATQNGASRIAATCQVRAVAGNIIADDFRFIGPHASRWPAPIRHIGQKFIRGLRHRYGYQAEDLSVSDWRGFNALGLGLAFDHATPDATLPIFHSERRNWRPLVRLA